MHERDFQFFLRPIQQSGWLLLFSQIWSHWWFFLLLLHMRVKLDNSFIGNGLMIYNWREISTSHGDILYFSWFGTNLLSMRYISLKWFVNRNIKRLKLFKLYRTIKTSQLFFCTMQLFQTSLSWPLTKSMIIKDSLE